LLVNKIITHPERRRDWPYEARQPFSKIRWMFTKIGAKSCRTNVLKDERRISVGESLFS
jgi:hypothetical protein